MNQSQQHLLSPDQRATDATRTALVLGGGGSAGNAWLVGVVAGLGAGGLDVTTADLIVGTSAGSTAAAQITAASPRDLYDATLSVPQPSPPGAARRPIPPRPADNQSHTDRLGILMAASRDAADLRRRLGAAALEQDAANDASVGAQWRATVASRLPAEEWPEQLVLLTAVDARTGEPVVFDRGSGVDLVDAVAASCSSGAAYRIGEGRYIDGGFRTTAENADLAAGYEHVLVLAPFGGRSLRPAEWGVDLATQVEALRQGGSRVHTIFPDGDAAEIFGPDGNVMSPGGRPIAARAGFEQGRALAASLIEFWG